MPRPPTALLLASALLLAACGGSDDEAAVASDTEALDFVAPDVRGGQVVGSELAGQDLVIWFWAPW